MGTESEDRLNRLLREAFPAVEVSPDFTMRLWRHLMEEPVRPPWMVPVPVLGLAAALGMALAFFTWGDVSQNLVATTSLARWDLFGNAPVDSLAGSLLNLMKGESV